MKLIVMGYKRHGKDAVCELIKARHGKTFTSSSWFCCKKFIFDELKNIHNYDTPEECFEDRVNHRQYWYESIRNYNSKDRARLGRDIFAIHDVYCGIRDLQELDAIKAAGLVDYVIWVDASGRLPPEDLSSMNISTKHADMYINNNGIEHDLPEQVDMVMKTAIEALYYRNG
jgi:hypothetical protein